jgi:hypothetical protein
MQVRESRAARQIGVPRMLPCLDPEEFWGWVELDRWKEKRRLECGQVVDVRYYSWFRVRVLNSVHSIPACQ